MEKEGLSIIVIEDNQGDFILVEDYLMDKFRAVNIEHFVDYKSASDFLKGEACKCDLILLDLNLPDMIGIELINNLIRVSPQIPIIILTGYVELPLAKRSLEMGVYDFLIKDEVNPALLHKSIEFAISRSNYVRQIEIQNEKLRNIAWTQSHVVRAPLSRILGIIDLIDDPKSGEDIPFWLEQLKISVLEIDGVIKKIIEQTQRLK